MTVRAAAFKNVNAVLADPPATGAHGKVLHVKVETADDQVRIDGFDSLEKVFVRVGDTDYPAQYTGKTRDGLDQHVVSITVPQNANIDSVAVGMDTNVGRVWGQSVNQDTPVHDVGAVDRNGVGYTSPLRVVDISGRHQSTREIADGDTVSFDANRFGGHGNMFFELDVFVPGASGYTALPPQLKGELLRRLDLRVESPLLAAGRAPLQITGHSGPSSNNFQLYWSLAYPGNYQGGPGRTHNNDGVYPVRIMMGDTVLRSFNLDWTADR